MNFRNVKRLYLPIFLIFSLIFSICFTVQAHAAKDKQKPVIKYSVSLKSNGKKAVLKLKVSDNLTLKEVKYSEGSHRKSFFTHSFYSKKIKKLSVTSAKSLSTEFSVKVGKIITVYAVDKSGNSVIKKIRIDKDIDNNVSGDDSNANTGNSENPSNNDKNGNTAGDGDNSNNNPQAPIVNTSEVRAVWITFLEFSSKGHSEFDFKQKIDLMFDNIVKSGMNTVYAQVRPFSDAFYNSAYFPWSKYVSGKQGQHPGYDPLAYMVDAAHARGLKLHAYINPYRVCTTSEFKNIAPNSPAYIWLNDNDDNNDRNVLKLGNMYYYNPSSSDVIALITNGVREIIENYAVDGVIFDDYFYPTLGKDYEYKFDSEEYDTYATRLEEAGNTPLSIVDWRRNNIDTMIKSVYATVKSVGKGLTFGISPAGNLNNLRAKDKYYINIDKWCSEDGYIDYIAPQLYWGFEHSVCPFEETVVKWMNVVTNPNVKLYVALGMHKPQAQDTDEWKNNHNILARMVLSLRNKNLGGFSLFRYDFMKEENLTKPGAVDELRNIISVILSGSY